ncbi:MAG: NAD kinase [Bacteroidota bacterium]
MKIALFGKNLNGNNHEYVQLLIDKIESLGISLIIYEPFFNSYIKIFNFNNTVQTFSDHLEIKDNVDFLLSLGGDGTLLDTITLVRDSGVPILGINMGRLGFLASINKDNILPALNAILEGNYVLDKRSLVRLETPSNPFGELNYALNEMTVYKQLPLSMLRVKVYVNDEFLNTYWSDGLIIATPTGSTAYSLSCGGPIITPESENFIITPIATHNLTVRPIVIPDNNIIRIEVETRNEEFFVSLDSRSSSIREAQELIVKKEKFKINLVRLNNQNFFSTIRHKLLWGSDARN